MFDPANNPFAIQNLLKKEQDETFLAKRDERPVVSYSDTALLKEVRSQTAVDFQLNELLDQPLPEVPTFEFEADDQSLPGSAAHEFPTTVDEPRALDVVSTEEKIQPTASDLKSDETVSSPLVTEASSISDLHADSAQDPTEKITNQTHADSSDGVELAEPETLPDHVALAHEPVREQLTDQVADLSLDTTTALDSTEHQLAPEAQPSSDVTEVSAEPMSTDVEIDAMAADSLTETSVAEVAEPEMAPGLDNAAVTELIEAAREEARVEAHALGFQEGLEAGLAQAKLEMQAEVDEKLAAVDQVIKGLNQLEHDPDALFEPMKKLAMHLAQQLVRGELTQSGQVIGRLVENCLRELAASGEKAVIIHLNPEDIEQYKPLAIQFGDSIILRPDALLARGSVRASLDGSVVEDVIERRVKGLTKSLAQPVASSWRPALPAAGAKPKANVAAQPAVAATPVTSIKADDLDHDYGDEEIFHDNDDDDAMIDAMIDESSMGDSDEIHTDRNDETHS